MRELHLFAGSGGGILGGMLLGHTTVCAVEIEPYCQQVLRARQRDGILPDFPIFGDIREFDGTKWRGAVDVVCGGFPCQDISAAGKGAGITGERSGLWSEMARVIGEVKPRFVFIENSPLLRTRGLGTVLQDLAKMGYNARWGVLGAWHVGAPHKRDRMWVLAYPKRKQNNQQRGSGDCGRGAVDGRRKATLCNNGQASPDGIYGQSSSLAYPSGKGPQGSKQQGTCDPERDGAKTHGPATQRSGLPRITWWDQDPAEVGNATSPRLERTTMESLQERESRPTESGEARTIQQRPTQPRLGRVAHGVANRVDRLKAIGNGQVPAVAATAFMVLSEGLNLQ